MSNSERGWTAAILGVIGVALIAIAIGEWTTAVWGVLFVGIVAAFAAVIVVGGRTDR